MPQIIINRSSLHYVLDPGPVANPHFLTVIFIHGSGNSSRRWQRQFPVSHTLASVAGELEPERIQFIALDLPGHAASEGEGCRTVQEYVEVIDQFVQALGLHKVVLVGNSLGGAIALQAALAFPPWLKGIGLVGTGAKLRVLPTILDQLAANIMPENLIAMSYSRSTPKELIEEIEADLSLTSNAVRLRDLLACDEFDIRTRLPEISIPSLIVVGEEDQLTPVKYAEYLNTNLGNATMVKIARAGHMVMYEQPDRFNQTLAEFLSVL